MNSKFARPITAPQSKIAVNRKQRRQMKQSKNMTAVERVERELEAQGKFGASIGDLLSVAGQYVKERNAEQPGVMTSTLEFMSAAKRMAQAWFNSIGEAISSCCTKLNGKFERLFVIVSLLWKKFLGWSRTAKTTVLEFFGRAAGCDIPDLPVEEKKMVEHIGCQYAKAFVDGQLEGDTLNNLLDVAPGYFKFLERSGIPTIELLLDTAKGQSRLDAKFDEHIVEAQGDDPWYVKYPVKATEVLTTFILAATTCMSSLAGFITKFDFSHFAAAYKDLTIACVTFSRTNVGGWIEWMLDMAYHAITGRHMTLKLQLRDEFKTGVTKLDAMLTEMDEYEIPPGDMRTNVTREAQKLRALLVPIMQHDSEFANANHRLFTDVTNRANKWLAGSKGSFRHKPVVLMMRGAAACGKTATQNYIAYNVLDVVKKGLKHCTDSKFKDAIRTMAQSPTMHCVNGMSEKREFEDGYTAQTVYAIEEFQTPKDPKIKADWMRWLFEIADSSPLLLNKAHLEEKGNSYFMSPFVITTGNSDSLHLPIESPVALHRRIEFDTVVTRAPLKDGEEFDVTKHVRYTLTSTCKAVLGDPKLTPSPVLSALYKRGVFGKQIDTPLSQIVRDKKESANKRAGQPGSEPAPSEFDYFEFKTLIQAMALVYIERLTQPLYAKDKYKLDIGRPSLLDFKVDNIVQSGHVIKSGGSFPLIKHPYVGPLPRPVVEAMKAYDFSIISDAYIREKMDFISLYRGTKWWTDVIWPVIVRAGQQELIRHIIDLLLTDYTRVVQYFQDYTEEIEIFHDVMDNAIHELGSALLQLHGEHLGVSAEQKQEFVTLAMSSSYPFKNCTDVKEFPEGSAGLLAKAEDLTDSLMTWLRTRDMDGQSSTGGDWYGPDTDDHDYDYAWKIQCLTAQVPSFLLTPGTDFPLNLVSDTSAALFQEWAEGRGILPRDYDNNKPVESFYSLYNMFVKFRPKLYTEFSVYPTDQSILTKAQKARLRTCFYAMMKVYLALLRIRDRRYPQFNDMDDIELLRVGGKNFSDMSPLSKKQFRYLCKQRGYLVSDRGNLTVDTVGVAKYKARVAQNNARQGKSNAVKLEKKRAEVKPRTVDNSEYKSQMSKGKNKVIARQNKRRADRRAKYEPQGNDAMEIQYHMPIYDRCIELLKMWEDEAEEVVDRITMPWIRTVGYWRWYMEKVYNSMERFAVDKWQCDLFTAVAKADWQYMSEDVVRVMMYYAIFFLHIDDRNKNKYDRSWYVFLFAKHFEEYGNAVEEFFLCIQHCTHFIPIVTVIQKRLEGTEADVEVLQRLFNSKDKMCLADIKHKALLDTIEHIVETIAAERQTSRSEILPRITTARKWTFEDVISLIATVGILVSVSYILYVVIANIVYFVTGTRPSVAEIDPTLSDDVPDDIEFDPQSLDPERIREMRQAKSATAMLQQRRAKLPSSGGDANSIENLFGKNFYTVVSSSNVRMGHVLFIFGQVAVMNKHVYHGVASRSISFVPVETTCVNREIVFSSLRDEATIIYEPEESDLIFFSVPHSKCAQHKHLVKHFVTNEELLRCIPTDKRISSTIRCPMMLSSSEKFETSVSVAEHAVIDQRSAHSAIKLFTSGPHVPMAISYSWTKAAAGRCGSVFAGQVSGNYKIFGIHAAGNAGDSFCRGQIITKEVAEIVFSRATSTSPTTSVSLDVSSRITRELTSQGYDIGTTITCDFKDTSCLGKTNFRPSPFHQSEFKGGATTRPANLTQIAYETTLAKEARRDICADPSPDAWRLAKEHASVMVDSFFPCDATVYAGCRTLTPDEALDADKRLEPVSPKSSDGLIMPALGVTSHDILTVGDKPPDDAKRKKVVDYLQGVVNAHLKYGDLPYQKNFDKLKDEPLENAFVDANKVRVFNVTDKLDCVLQKMAVGDLVAKTKFAFTMGPQTCGVDPRSGFWQIIYHEFDRTRVFASDVGGFDYTVNRIMKPFIDVLLLRAYASPIDRVFAAWSVVSCLCSLRFNRRIGRYRGCGNTSGNWLTTWINTICNAVYFMTATAFLAEQANDDPVACIRTLRLRLYSDDNITMLERDWYLPGAMAKAFWDLFKVELTATDKGSIWEVPLMPIGDIEFLSRGFRVEKGVVFAPLAESSLYARLFWLRIPKKFLGDRTYRWGQLQQNLDGFFDELMEYPMEQGDAMAKEVIDWVVAKGWPLVIKYVYHTDRCEWKISLT